MSGTDPDISRIAFDIEGARATCSGLVQAPPDARAFYLFAHGAGAGMRHPFMASMAGRLARRSIATLRYQFLYMEQGKRRPDPAHLLERTVRSAAAWALSEFSGLPLFAGGKSMGGRMTSRAHAAEPLPGVRGLVFFGFPLHPRGKPDVGRADHLADVELPMLFLQGTRDDLAELSLIGEVCAGLGPRATLRTLEGADHSFAVRKRSGRTRDEVLDELAAAASEWIAGQV